jgi:NadR type nicotinamide-nucleotide adenylyltransferase
MKPFQTGVVIGKFYPPHRGHKFLIETALAQVERLTVIVCEHEGEVIPGHLRAAWLREIHPEARVLLIQDIYDADDDSELWARLTIEWLGHVPDVCFTSEYYGTTWAHYMGCRHVLVDQARQAIPISATRIRRAPLEHWEFLEPQVRAHFAKRVCVMGAESSGTTTLSLALAGHYNTAWVPEYGRDYSWWKLRRGEETWTSEEFVDIAREQNRREDALAREANRVLICDTNTFATRLWHERYMGFLSPQVDAVAAAGRCDLYLLTDVNIPFVQDGLRDGEHIRKVMHQRFIEELEAQPVPWQLISGSPEERFARATEVIEALLHPGHQIYPERS